MCLRFVVIGVKCCPSLLFVGCCCLLFVVVCCGSSLVFAHYLFLCSLSMMLFVACRSLLFGDVCLFVLLFCRRFLSLVVGV